MNRSGLAAALLALTLLVAGGETARADGFGDAVASLDRLLQGDDFEAQIEGVRRVVGTGEARAVPAVVERIFGYRDQFVFEHTLTILRTDTNEAQKEALVKQAGTVRSWETRAMLTRLIGRLGDVPGLADTIEGNLKHARWEVRVAAIAAARERGTNRLAGALVARLAQEEGRVAGDLRAALTALTGADLGERAEDWERWWASVKDSIEVHGAPAAEPEDEDSEEAAGEPADEEVVDVGTLSREPLYKVQSKRVLFIVDVSGSMATGTDAGTRLAVTKRELARVLDEQLDKGSRFNVMFFSDKVTLWKKKGVPASKSACGQAKRVVKKLKADGLTATYDAFKKAFELEDIDTIYFLSDGAPSVGAQTITQVIREEVKAWNRARGVVIHTIAFMAGENPKDIQDKPEAVAFMRELAKENGGTFKLIE